MQLNELFTSLRDEDRGVCPVIGVMLMVAITVILAAVVATFVLGLGDSLSSTSPQVKWEINGVNLGDTNTKNDGVKTTHNGSDEIDAANLKVTIGGTTIYEDGGLASGITDWSKTEASGWGSDTSAIVSLTLKKRQQ